MITILTIYNNKDFFERVLLQSLKSQSTPYELIAIDNSGGKYTSAAQAFNIEMRNATGNYILFAHQDVEFSGKNWLRDIEFFCDQLVQPGIIGFAGFNVKGQFKGYLSSCGEELGEPFSEAIEVQTVDGYLFMVPKSITESFCFDEKNFDGWHLYSDDYSLTLQTYGFKTYVIPFYTYHRSLSLNRSNIAKYKRRFFLKYRGTTFTSVGIINKKYFIKSFFESLSEPWYKWFFPHWSKWLATELKNCRSVLELKCGCNSTLGLIDNIHKTAVDDDPKCIEESRKKNLHHTYIEQDILQLSFQKEEFDATYTYHTLSGLNAQKREHILNAMETYTLKKVIVVDLNINDELVDQLKIKGYRIRGLGGLKYLYNEKGFIALHPSILFLFFNDVCGRLTFFFPKLAPSFIAIKRKN